MPRPGTPLAHPDVVTASGRFTSTAAVERLQEGQDEFGDPIETWVQVATAPCHPAVINGPQGADGDRGGETRGEDDTIQHASWTVLCAGTPDAKPTDRVKVDGSLVGQITQVESDHIGRTTRLLAEVIG